MKETRNMLVEKLRQIIRVLAVKNGHIKSSFDHTPAHLCTNYNNPEEALNISR